MVLMKWHNQLTVKVRQCEARLMDAMVMGDNVPPFELGNTTMTLTGLPMRLSSITIAGSHAQVHLRVHLSGP